MSANKELKDSVKFMRLLGASDEEIYVNLIEERDREARLKGSTCDRDDTRFAIWKIYGNSNVVTFRVGRILNELRILRILLLVLTVLAAISVARQFMLDA